VCFRVSCQMYGIAFAFYGILLSCQLLFSNYYIEILGVDQDAAINFVYGYSFSNKQMVKCAGCRLK
jgi:hypothetical protein